ncbi:hypothetical protein KYB31_16190 [Clostridium felsineum]|uniref:pectinesterase family protein n=1 Tax=Clostridium felsineum TaxID=36839 RepID=UPI00214D77AF|nr:pectinesterase family protein [Clostridium felsineum]MCR3760520.1 hypothetical protein [Clostridium felsineum]
MIKISKKTIGKLLVLTMALTAGLGSTTIGKIASAATTTDLYVGDSSKQKNYSTVKAAVDAAAKINPKSESQRVTIHIAPGVYRAQLKIVTPYITLLNSNPSKQVKITWYYGFGYDYYSVGSDGFYNQSSATAKNTKNNVSSGKWGGSVYLTSNAKEFKAENIVFENSFNKYVTKEEVEDGVTPSRNFPQSISKTLTQRTLSTNVTSKVETERAAAMIIEADNAEFYKCKFIGSQDTLYTGSNGSNNSYFKNCTMEGNTDYIFGDGNTVFDNSTLNFCGYSDQATGGYITAARDTATCGYLFRNCTITANSSNKQTAGYFGRPWGAGARVTFLNTKLQNSTIINPDGWASMSTNVAKNAHFAEYKTTYNNAEVGISTSLRKRFVLSSSNAAKIDATKYFGGWTPKYYTTK